jgi:hypothetical protein
MTAPLTDVAIAFRCNFYLIEDFVVLQCIFAFSLYIALLRSFSMENHEIFARVAELEGPRGKVVAALLPLSIAASHSHGHNFNSTWNEIHLLLPLSAHA